MDDVNLDLFTSHRDTSRQRSRTSKRTRGLFLNYIYDDCGLVRVGPILRALAVARTDDIRVLFKLAQNMLLRFMGKGLEVPVLLKKPGHLMPWGSERLLRAANRRMSHEVLSAQCSVTIPPVRRTRRAVPGSDAVCAVPVAESTWRVRPRARGVAGLTPKRAPCNETSGGS